MPQETSNDIILRELPEQLIGDRVIVRPYRPGDGPAMFEAVDESRQHLLPWMKWSDNYKAPDDAEAFARRNQIRWLLREDLSLGVWEKETGRYLGGSGLHRINWLVPSFEIGYWLRRSATGHGYMTEVVGLLRDMAFEQLNAKRVFIRCAAENIASRNVALRTGFLLEATLRNDIIDADGVVHDTLVLTLTPEDYAKWRANNIQITPLD